MSLIQFLRILIARRWIILASTLTCFAVALIVAFLLPARYQAHARVILDVLKPDPVTGQSLTLAASRGYFNTQLQIIQDYRVAGDVVDKMGWMNNPDIAARWQSETGGQGDMRRWAAQGIIDNTKAGLVEGSNILEITYTGPSPAVAKAVVNLIRDAYIQNSLRMRTDSAGRTAAWYSDQAEKAQKSLSAAEAAKAKFEQENGLVVTAQGQEAESAKLQAMQTALMQARAGVNGTEFAGQRQAEGGAALDQLRIQAAAIDDQLEQAGEKLGTQHPTYKAILARRDLMRTQLARAEADAKKNGAAVSAFAQRNVASLESDYNAQKQKVLGMRDTIDRWQQLARETDLRREQYQKAAQRAAELKLESDVSETGLVVLGDSFADANPSFPKIPMIAGLAFGFGLAFGIALAMFLEMLARRVRGPEDLVFAAKAPVFAVVSDVQPSPMREKLRNLLTRRRSGDAPSWQPAQ